MTTALTRPTSPPAAICNHVTSASVYTVPYVQMDRSLHCINNVVRCVSIVVSWFLLPIAHCTLQSLLWLVHDWNSGVSCEFQWHSYSMWDSGTSISIDTVGTRVIAVCNVQSGLEMTVWLHPYNAECMHIYIRWDSTSIYVGGPCTTLYSNVWLFMHVWCSNNIRLAGLAKKILYCTTISILCYCTVPSPSSSPVLRSHCRKFLATTRVTARPSRSSVPVSCQL